MKHQNLRIIALLAIVEGLLGCAPKNIRVRCDEHLQPINPPTAAAASDKKSGKTSTLTPSEESQSGAVP